MKTILCRSLIVALAICMLLLIAIRFDSTKDLSFEVFYGRAEYFNYWKVYRGDRFVIIEICPDCYISNGAYTMRTSEYKDGWISVEIRWRGDFISGDTYIIEMK